jgi:hypothetical protein
MMQHSEASDSAGGSSGTRSSTCTQQQQVQEPTLVIIHRQPVCVHACVNQGIIKILSEMGTTCTC